MEEMDLFKKQIEIFDQTNKTNSKEFSKIAGRLEALNETVNDCFEALNDLYMIEKEKAVTIKQIAGFITDEGLACQICKGIRHGLFGQDAQNDASLYDFVNAVNVPLSQLVNAVETLIDVQSGKGTQDAEASK